MKTNIIKTYILAFTAALLLAACGNDTNNKPGESSGGTDHGAGEHHGHGNDVIVLTDQQFKSLEMEIDSMPMRNISSFVEANGLLEVPPQNEATVTAIIGANITSIKVIEGDKVKKGQVLAYLSHPDLIKLQTDYINSWNQLQYLEKEYQRQKKLYEEKVGSGKEFQKTQADYQSMKGTVKGYEAQLKMMGLNLDNMLNGEIYEYVPVRSPISGHIRLVEVKMGQYVQPQTEMFEIVNIDHIHADLMVFEKDVHKVKEGQKVRFSVESSPGKELEATIYNVGKSFEQNPKAIHLHAEIENKQGLLIPGMYVRGRIMIGDIQSYAMPDAGIVREGDKYFIFATQQEGNNEQNQWTFVPIEVIIGARDNGWTEVKLLAPLPEGTKVAWNNAYYLLAELKKGDADHDH
ncbi:efflux RND transporter periplasmic adaptor subunit [bacterium]|nr:efflux RND transporter periplasmic adaptor subunit [bacterium]